MTNKDAIDWLGLLKHEDIEFDDYSEDTKELREKAIACFQEALDLGIAALENQKTGHWVVYSELTGEWEGTKKYACDKCGEKVGVFKSNYCPNCGARMVKTDDFDIKMHCRSYDCKTNKCTRGYDLDCDNCIKFRTW